MLPENPKEAQSVLILRDTGGSQSGILTNTLSFSNRSACGSNVVLSGIEMGCVSRPLHNVHIQSKLVSGGFPVAVCPALPVSDVTMVLGNDIAGGRVVPSLDISDAAPPRPVPAE